MPNHASKVNYWILAVPDGLVVRIRRSHRRGRGSIPRLGEGFHEGSCNITRTGNIPQRKSREKAFAANPNPNPKSPITLTLINPNPNCNWYFIHISIPVTYVNVGYRSHVEMEPG